MVIAWCGVGERGGDAHSDDCARLPHSSLSHESNRAGQGPSPAGVEVSVFTGFTPVSQSGSPGAGSVTDREGQLAEICTNNRKLLFPITLLLTSCILCYHPS